ncbi:30S ribosomal protein S2 [Posidoniimonas corsicana]|nr:30S ribosomal protein S2 [Posidoniimonas corsicana]
MSTLVKELVEAGVHFGHRSSRWNPKMRPYIYARKNTIHIIDVRETIRGLLRAKKYLADVAARGSLILWVGTKRQAAESVEREASRCGMPFVAERWLGGTLTNFRTIRDRLSRLEELEGIRQSDALNSYSKKAQASLNREYKKMYRNLNGMRTMNRLPECMVVIDPKKEKNAVKEARKLGIAVVSLIDTDCDPDTVDLPIPGNDDSMRSIEMITKILADAIVAGKTQQAMQQQAASEGSDKPAEAPAEAVAAGEASEG